MQVFGVVFCAFRQFVHNFRQIFHFQLLFSSGKVYLENLFCISIKFKKVKQKDWLFYVDLFCLQVMQKSQALLLVQRCY